MGVAPCNPNHRMIRFTFWVSAVWPVAGYWMAGRCREASVVGVGSREDVDPISGKPYRLTVWSSEEDSFLYVGHQLAIGRVAGLVGVNGRR